MFELYDQRVSKLPSGEKVVLALRQSVAPLVMWTVLTIICTTLNVYAAIVMLLVTIVVFVRRYENQIFITNNRIIIYDRLSDIHGSMWFSHSSRLSFYVHQNALAKIFGFGRIKTKDRNGNISDIGDFDMAHAVAASMHAKQDMMYFSWINVVYGIIVVLYMVFAIAANSRTPAVPSAPTTVADSAAKH